FVSRLAALSGTVRAVSSGRETVSRFAGVVSLRAGRTGAAGGGTGAGRGRVVSGSPLERAPAPPPACGWRNSIGWRNAVAIDRPCRRAGAKRSLRAPVSAAEASAG